MAFVTILHLQASADAALSCEPGRPVTRGGNGYVCKKSNNGYFAGRTNFYGKVLLQLEVII